MDTYTQPSGSILRLNDDCLMEIFDYLDLITLSNVAKTCKQLKNVALRTFGRQYKHLIAQQWQLVDADCIFIKNDCLNVLTTFSEKAKSVRVFRDEYTLLANFPYVEEVVFLNRYYDAPPYQIIHQHVREWCPNVRGFRILK